jgi:hypothetical protein
MKGVLEKETIHLPVILSRKEISRGSDRVKTEKVTGDWIKLHNEEL